MKRGEPPKRKTPLKRSTEPIKRAPLKRKRAKESALLKKSRRLAYERAEGLCEAAWQGCSRRAEHAHHIRRRSQGGSDEAANLLIVCAFCHGQIHANPRAAAQKGHLLLVNDA